MRMRFLAAGAGCRAETADTKYLLFRGRSALTLLLSVTINGIEKKVPVGTTIRGLLNAAGVYGPDVPGLKWLRRSPYGRETRIRFSGIPGDLPVMHGDRIEV